MCLELHYDTHFNIIIGHGLTMLQCVCTERNIYRYSCRLKYYIFWNEKMKKTYMPIAYIPVGVGTTIRSYKYKFILIPIIHIQ